jgi:Flp pilus assembly pilin Flp
MNNLFSKVRCFLASEGGPTAVEYGVMLALIVVVCFATIHRVTLQSKSTFSNAGNALRVTNVGS